MSEVKDPAIKLFGKTIQLASNDDVSHAVDEVVGDCEQSSSDPSKNNNCVSCSNDSVSPTSLFDKTSASGEGSMESKQEDVSLTAVLEEQPPYEDKELSSPKASKNEEQTETSGPEEKPLKRPEKILPCPRCSSMDTKFCYFNNYNVNQPRHFCKKCQRYWTAGGTMRNVPVGAGRRKNKNSSSSNPRFIVIPDTSDGVIYPTFRANESPLCESMTSSLTMEEKPSHNVVPNPVTQEPNTTGFQGIGPRLPCFPAPPWPNPWNTLPYPVPIYATPPSWSCGVPASWIQPPSGTTEYTSSSSGPSSPLGKHPREGGEAKRNETKVLVPKTLRFDDPSEAAKSSIWTTLGIKNQNTSRLDSGVFFRGLQAKGGQISSASETASVLQANPAAMSRSLTYHESAE